MSGAGKPWKGAALARLNGERAAGSKQRPGVPCRSAVASLGSLTCGHIGRRYGAWRRTTAEKSDFDRAEVDALDASVKHRPRAGESLRAGALGPEAKLRQPAESRS